MLRVTLYWQWCLFCFRCAHSIESESRGVPRTRPRAAAVRNPSVNTATAPRQAGAGADHSVECAMRRVAYDMSQRHPTGQRHAADIFRSLQLGECESTPHPRTVPKLGPCMDGSHWSLCVAARAHAGAEKVVFVDSSTGSDKNDGTISAPFQTVTHAQIASRAMGVGTYVLLRAGTYHLKVPLRFTEEDSGITWSAYGGEEVVFSAGAPLVGLEWKRWKGEVLVADLPPTINASAVDSLFEVADGPATKRARRLVRARYPNGNSEMDLMPTNYDKLGGGVGYVHEWIAAGNQSLHFSFLERNSSFYPWFEHSNDARWVIDYHTENASSYYRPQSSFWHADISLAARYNSTTFSQNVGLWSNVDDAVVHVAHYDWWGNWQWRLQAVDTSSQIITFGEGGWQDAHGGPVAHNYFFVENLLAELDVEGEWYVDRRHRRVYYWPHSDAGPPATWRLVVSQHPTAVYIEGTSAASIVTSFSLAGITIAHTTTAYVAQRYAVPSAGDWSVSLSAAVVLTNVRDVQIRGCTFAQIGGNGVSLVGLVHDSIIADSDFLKTGDSGVVSVGFLPTTKPYDGSEVNTFPTNVTIERCHFGQIGIFGKQTSALFVAVSKRINFLDNVAYDGPRAGININDGFGGGHVIARNVIFNQLLESGDHGPVNTWSRTAYLQRGQDGKATTIQEWSRIDQNFLMIGPKFGALYGPGNGPCSNGIPDFYCPKGGGSMFTCLDHDDGSDFYLDTRNVCVFAGMKNYIGQNKIWDSNLIVYPEGANSQNRSGMGCVWTSMFMGGNQSTLPCTATTGRCHNKEVFTNNTCVSHTKQPFEYDNFDAVDLSIYGPRNTSMPFTERNQHYLGIEFRFQGVWNHSEAISHGVDVGGVVYPEMTLPQLKVRAYQFLGLTVPDEGVGIFV